MVSVRSRRPSIPYMICSDAVLGRFEVGDELHELVRLPVEVEPVQRLQGEGGVAHPGVAVVPVALAPGRLGKRGRERRHRGAGRHVGHALDRERRALDLVREAVVGQPRPRQPGAPEAGRRRHPGLGVGEILRDDEPLGPRERTVRPLSRTEDVTGADAIALDPEREVRPEPDGLPLSTGVRRVLAAVDQRPFGRRPSVVEHRLAHEVDLHLALQALDRPHQHVVGVVVRRWPGVGRDRVGVCPRSHRQRVADRAPTPMASSTPSRARSFRARRGAPSGGSMPNGAKRK